VGHPDVGDDPDPGPGHPAQGGDVSPAPAPQLAHHRLGLRWRVQEGERDPHLGVEGPGTPGHPEPCGQHGHREVLDGGLAGRPGDPDHLGVHRRSLVGGQVEEGRAGVPHDHRGAALHLARHQCCGRSSFERVIDVQVAVHAFPSDGHEEVPRVDLAAFG
jgi:hypothetical protein